jgi:hypothetical protein
LRGRLGRLALARTRRLCSEEEATRRWNIDNWRRRCTGVEPMPTFARQLALDLLKERDKIVANGPAAQQVAQQAQEGAASAAGAPGDVNLSLSEKDAQYLKESRKRNISDLLKQFNQDETFKRLRLAALVNGKRHEQESLGNLNVAEGSICFSRDNGVPKRKLCVLCKKQTKQRCKCCDVVLCVEFRAGTDKRSKTCWDKWHSAVRLEPSAE